MASLIESSSTYYRDDASARWCKQAMKRVVFVSPFAYPVFDPRQPSDIGGAEVRASLFAKGLAKRFGFEVIMLVDTDERRHVQKLDDLTLWAEPRHCEASALFRFARRLCSRAWLDARDCIGYSASFPWLKLYRWRTRLLWQLPFAGAYELACWYGRRGRVQARPRPFYASLDADTWCGFGVQETTFSIVAHCQATGKKSVLFLASDHTLCEDYSKKSSCAGPFDEPADLCHYTIVHADQIIVQTLEQQRLLQQRFGRDSVVIRNPIDLDAPVECDSRITRHALWIGRAERFQKRPELCYQLARHCPDIPFIMILNRGYRHAYDQIAKKAPPNVRVIRHVPYDQIERYFASAAVFVNTSAFEGFPNTFLQAGKYSVPVLSLDIDPDGFLTQFDCGFCAQGNLEQMASSLRRIWTDSTLAGIYGRAIRAYVQERHDWVARVQELEHVLNSVV